MTTSHFRHRNGVLGPPEALKGAPQQPGQRSATTGLGAREKKKWPTETEAIEEEQNSSLYFLRPIIRKLPQNIVITNASTANRELRINRKQHHSHSSCVGFCSRFQPLHSFYVSFVGAIHIFRMLSARLISRTTVRSAFRKQSP